MAFKDEAAKAIGATCTEAVAVPSTIDAVAVATAAAVAGTTTEGAAGGPALTAAGSAAGGAGGAEAASTVEAAKVEDDVDGCTFSGVIGARGSISSCLACKNGEFRKSTTSVVPLTCSIMARLGDGMAGIEGGE